MDFKMPEFSSSYFPMDEGTNSFSNRQMQETPLYNYRLFSTTASKSPSGFLGNPPLSRLELEDFMPSIAIDPPKEIHKCENVEWNENPNLQSLNPVETSNMNFLYCEIPQNDEVVVEAMNCDEPALLVKDDCFPPSNETDEMVEIFPPLGKECDPFLDQISEDEKLQILSDFISENQLLQNEEFVSNITEYEDQLSQREEFSNTKYEGQISQKEEIGSVPLPQAGAECQLPLIELMASNPDFNLIKFMTADTVVAPPAEMSLPPVESAVAVSPPPPKRRGRPPKKSCIENEIRQAEPFVGVPYDPIPLLCQDRPSRSAKRQCEKKIRMAIYGEGESAPGMLDDPEYKPDLEDMLPSEKRPRVTHVEEDSMMSDSSTSHSGETLAEREAREKREKNNRASKKSRDRRTMLDKTMKTECEKLTERNKMLVQREAAIEAGINYIKKILILYSRC